MRCVRLVVAFSIARSLGDGEDGDPDDDGFYPGRDWNGRRLKPKVTTVLHTIQHQVHQILPNLPQGDSASLLSAQPSAGPSAGPSIHDSTTAGPHSKPSSGPSVGPSVSPSIGPSVGPTTTESATASITTHQTTTRLTTTTKRATTTTTTTLPVTTTTTLPQPFHGVDCASPNYNCAELARSVNASHEAKQIAFNTLRNIMSTIQEEIRGNEPSLVQSIARAIVRVSEHDEPKHFQGGEGATFSMCRDDLKKDLALATARGEKKKVKRLGKLITKLEKLQKKATKPELKQIVKGHFEAMQKKVEEAHKAMRDWRIAAKAAREALEKAHGTKSYYNRLYRRAKVVSHKWSKAVDDLQDADKMFEAAFHDDLEKTVNEDIDKEYESNTDDDNDNDPDDEDYDDDDDTTNANCESGATAMMITLAVQQSQLMIWPPVHWMLAALVGVVALLVVRAIAPRRARANTFQQSLLLNVDQA